MPLTQASLNAAVTFALQATNNFGTLGGTPVTESFAQPALDLTTWTQAFAAQYTLFVGPPTGLGAVLATGGTLTSGTTYYYKVTGVGPSGANGTIESGPSAEASATPAGGNLTVNLTWNVLQGASGGYNIYRGTAPGAENLLVGTATQPSTGTTQTFSDTGFAGSAGSPPSAPANYVEFSIRTFTNLANESVTGMGHALSLFVLPSGTNAQCTLTPGSVNGLQWFFGGLTQSHACAINGVFQHVEDPAGAGVALSAGANTLRVTNGGTGTLTATIVAIVGP